LISIGSRIQCFSDYSWTLELKVLKFGFKIGRITQHWN
jgi:hypothetical protein